MSTATDRKPSSLDPPRETITENLPTNMSEANLNDDNKKQDEKKEIPEQFNDVIADKFKK